MGKIFIVSKPVFVSEKVENQKTKPTFIISVLKVVYYLGVISKPLPQNKNLAQKSSFQKYWKIQL